MELAEEMLKRMATNIGDLRLRVHLLQQMLTPQVGSLRSSRNGYGSKLNRRTFSGCTRRYLSS
jgi:hypothetical protein